MPTEGGFMDQNTFVIFAELRRDHFDEILQTLKRYFEHIESGRQGDDWIGIHIDNDTIEIDSFYSMELEIKGKLQHLVVVSQFLQQMAQDWIIQIFDPPKNDMTR